MNEKKLKKLEIVYKISLILGLLGLIDILTNKMTHIDDIGYVSILILYFFKALFGIKVAVFIGTVINGILRLSLLFLINAYIIKQKINKIKESVQKNKGINQGDTVDKIDDKIQKGEV